MEPTSKYTNYIEPELRNEQGMPFVVLREGESVVQFKEVLPNPLRHTGCESFETLESFYDYVNRFKSDTTLLTLDGNNRVPSQLLAVFNHHSVELPGHTDFRALIEFQTTDEFRMLRDNQHAHMRQRAFGEWLDNNEDFIIDPPHAELDKLIRNLRSSRSMDVTYEYDNSYDNKVVTQQSEVTPTGGVTLPREMQIAVSVLHSTQPMVFKLRLTFSVSEDNTVRIRYRIKNLDAGLKLLADQIRKNTETATGLKVYC